MDRRPDPRIGLIRRAGQEGSRLRASVDVGLHRIGSDHIRPRPSLEETVSPERRRDGDDLTGRRRGYDELKGELHHFFRRIWTIVILIGVTSTLALVGYGFALAEIQQQRLEVCKDQNSKHDNTVTKLNDAALFDENSRKTEAGKAEVRRRRDVTIALIDAITPVRDCDVVVDTGLSAYLPW